MQVNDKMVEAACDAWIDAHASGKAQSLPEGLRLALTGALAHREAEAVGVTMEMIERLVDAEVDSEASNSGGGAPSNEKQAELDGEIVAARTAIRSALVAPPAQEVVAWRDMSIAPKDGTFVRLLVQPGRSETDGWTPFADSSDPYQTIGFNALSDTMEDVWQFAGWDWCHDCFTDGAGEVIGWLPFDAAPPAQEPVAWTSQGNLDGVRKKPREAWSMWGSENGLINCPLYAAPPAVPEGMMLVPREPTREMWAAMADILYGYKNRHHDKVAGDLWAAALTAAQEGR